jgi:hypothetical protein
MRFPNYGSLRWTKAASNHVNAGSKFFVEATPAT